MLTHVKTFSITLNNMLQTHLKRVKKVVQKEAEATGQ